MKSKFLVVILIIALINAMSGCSSQNNDMALFRGNLERTGVYDVDGSVPSGGIKWKFKTGHSYLSSPVISQGMVYVSGDSGYLLAVDANTGQKMWEFKRKGHVGSPPAVSNGKIFVGDLGYSIYAVDTKTGKEIWKSETSNYILSSPAVSDGYVYFGNYDGYLYAVSAETGQEIWKFKTQGTGFLAPGREPATDYGMKGAIASSPAIYENVIYFGSYDSYLYALDANTGREKWKFKTDDVIFKSTPAVKDSVIYFGSDDGYLYAINSDGQGKWKFNTKDFLTIPSQAIQTRLDWISSPAITNGIIYFGVSYKWSEHLYDDGSDNRLNYLFAIDMITGQFRWKIQATSISPTVSNNTVYYGNDEGYVFALNALTGQEIWKFKADSGIVSDVVVMGGVAYFCSKDGYLYAVK